MVKGPVCGVTVSENTAQAKLVYQGQTYCLCRHKGGMSGNC